MASGHVYVRVSGYGLALMPCAPFRIRRESGDARLRFASPAGEAVAVVTGQALAGNAAIFDVTGQVADSTRPPE